MINVLPLYSPFSNFTVRMAEAFGNAKTKIFSDGTTKTVYCRKAIFKKPLAEKINYRKCFFENFVWTELRESLKSCLDKYRFKKVKDFLGIEFDDKFVKDSDSWENFKLGFKLSKDILFVKKSRPTGEPRPDSLKRAKDRIFDYTFNNNFNYFFTGTINQKRFNAKDPKLLLKPIQYWLKNHVNRDGFQYIIVAEYHKSGAIHFHGLINCNDSDLVDSGTKTYKGFKKPMKDRKAIKKGLVPERDGKIVYNFPKWRFGFTTCIKTYGDPLNVAYYITKYITKDCKKIFGKFFWHSRDLKKPDILVHDVDYDSIEAVEYKGAYKYELVRPDEYCRKVYANSLIKSENKRLQVEQSEFGEIYCDIENGFMINLDTGEVYYDDLNTVDLSDYETLLE